MLPAEQREHATTSADKLLQQPYRRLLQSRLESSAATFIHFRRVSKLKLVNRLTDSHLSARM
jgi:hypothetical protein